MLAGIQIDGFSIIILLVIYFLGVSRIDKGRNKLFDKVIFATVIILVLDLFMYLFDGNSRPLNIIVTTLYYIFTPVVGLCSIIYLHGKIQRCSKKIKLIKKLVYPLFGVYTVACLISMKTGWIFIIDENAVYHRGSFFWISEVFCLLLISFPVIDALRIVLRTKDRVTRRAHSEIIFFVIPPTIGALIQLFFYGTSTNWIGLVISILIVFIGFQNEEISTDPLTGINNRRVLYRYLEYKTTLLNEKQRLFLYLIDVNDFKNINDNFGHAEGDAALIYISEIIRSACYVKNDFFARIGGDEFAIVCIRSAERDTSELTDSIEEKINRFNRLKCAQYKLSLSIGCTEYSQDDTKTVDELMKKADNNMYKNKNRQKSLGEND